MPLEIVRNDLTKMKVDAIVNAANTGLQMGGGVCGAIFRAAGAGELQGACDQIGGCQVGEAVITNGFNLEPKYIIHTPGPIWQGGTNQEADLLKNSYFNSLELAKKYRCNSIAFPLISTGIYGYPKEEALQIAISTISSYLLHHDLFVYLVVFDKSSFGISKKLFQSIEEYIDENYVDEAGLTFNRNRVDPYVLEEMRENQCEIFKEAEYSLVNLLDQLDESFSERLLRFIDEKGMTDVETYKRANLDRRLFSKIRTSVDYSPKKKTAVALAIALQLDFKETLELLSAAGYTLSQSSKFDVIIQYFIHQANYNIHQINEVLFSFDQPLLGA
ncbi:O-acetyl-ADP-ribose deacetylase (regulator of RNase III) [Bacillus sp. SORGH_AS 510]|uniref:macro domain-containing protein n=1 Tax=Bacillus sp. SORGH_AS_0510 TaxID=3041771 RepID=UPI0027858024|nr:macro domain-containing protein [Bacillus sp. SORGH_AS_0510]MDQ1146031.1 O-acetyl-ADP-ribose deacetylase (regulator of RNase III) [Bacillus sp. SORGH_AS_0510]